MRHPIRWLALVASVALLATACGGDEGGGGGGGTAAKDLAGVTITFSTALAVTEEPAVKEVLEMFQDQTGATVNITKIDAADLPQKLKVEVDANRHTIHLFAQDNLALATLVDENLVEDLSDVEIPDGVSEALIPEKFDGKAYFLPYRPNVRVAYVNKDRFSSAGATPPTSVEEFIATAQKLKQTGGGQPKVTLSLATAPDTGPAGVTISEWIVSYGGDPLILNDPGSVQAFTQLQQLWQQGLLARESLQGKFDTEVNYLQGETAWLAQNWPFTSSELAKQGLLEKFQVYQGWAGPAREAHVVGGEVVGIPRGVSGKEKEAAVALGQFLMSKEAQEILVAKNAWPSVRDDALAQVPEEQRETFDAIQKALENGWYRPNVVYWSDVQNAMGDAIRLVMVQGQPVEATLDQLHAKIEEAAKAKGAEYPPAG